MYDSHQPPQGGEEEEYVNQAVQDLEKYALKKSQDTTSTIKNCVRVAEDTMGIGVQTLITLHDQGIQIERTHEKAVDIDQHLSRVKYIFSQCAFQILHGCIENAAACDHLQGLVWNSSCI
jgi:hypothetical protein